MSGRKLKPQGLRALTEDDDVEDQDDEANDTTTGAVLPAVVDGASGDLLSDGGGKGEGGQAELEEEGVDVLIHDAVFQKAQGGIGSKRCWWLIRLLCT